MTDISQKYTFTQWTNLTKAHFKQVKCCNNCSYNVLFEDNKICTFPSFENAPIISDFICDNFKEISENDGTWRNR